MAAPALDDHFRLGKFEEALAIDEYVPELRVEDLAATVFPETGGLNVSSSDADGGDPAPHRLRCALRAIARREQALQTDCGRAETSDSTACGHNRL